LLDMRGSNTYHPTMTKAETALQRAIAIAGGPAALARMIGVTKQAIVQWKRLPPRRVPAVSSKTGVSREDLRPDIYGAN